MGLLQRKVRCVYYWHCQDYSLAGRSVAVTAALLLGYNLPYGRQTCMSVDLVVEHGHFCCCAAAVVVVDCSCCRRHSSSSVHWTTW